MAEFGIAPFLVQQEVGEREIFPEQMSPRTKKLSLLSIL